MCEPKDLLTGIKLVYEGKEVLFGKPKAAKMWRDAWIEFTREPKAISLDAPKYTDGNVY
jgi:hypothetical protein